MLAFNHFLSIECDDPDAPVEAVIPYLLLTLFLLEIPFINNILEQGRTVWPILSPVQAFSPCFLAV
jgi:hypothetical protein